ncbi:MAG: protein kinase [Candidatus Accumulibacter sp.]|nr:protein kinase [Accumulibacter sp.]
MKTQTKISLPEKIGKYEILRIIGRGTTSTVYLARDPVSDLEVAIKVAMPETLKDPERGKLYTHLFLTEASLVGKLSHPYIAQIYNSVVSGPTYYIVMEYIPGGTLEEYCVPWKLLAVEDVVEIIFKCARALDFAFRIGIIHRDIKPANILVSSITLESVNIKISDFGAALVDTPDRTQVSGIGSPAYMSPQQVMELPLNHQTDIYSLGIVMYQLLTGQLPFQGSTNYNIIYQIINTEPPPPSTIREGLPEMLDKIVMKAICKETSGRYATWTEFTHDLAQCSRQKLLRTISGDFSDIPEEFSDTEKIDILCRLSFFSGFSNTEIFEILAFAQWGNVVDGQVIIHNDEANDSFCILIEGEANICKNGKILGLLKAGESFGEMPAVSRTQPVCGVDIVACSAAKIVTIRNEVLHQVSETCRLHFHEAFMETLAGRLSRVYNRLALL